VPLREDSPCRAGDDDLPARSASAAAVRASGVTAAFPGLGQ